LIAQDVAKTRFLSKLMHNLNCGKRSPTIWATSVFLTKCQEMTITHLGKFSPNLVTLVGGAAVQSRPAS
jgi:hypothetical protein